MKGESIMSTKKKTLPYYAIAGLNAYGVFTDCSKALTGVTIEKILIFENLL